MLCLACLYFMVRPQLNCTSREESSQKLTLLHFTFRPQIVLHIQEKRSNSNISDGVGLALHLFFSPRNNQIVILRVLALKWKRKKYLRRVRKMRMSSFRNECGIGEKRRGLQVRVGRILLSLLSTEREILRFPALEDRWKQVRLHGEGEGLER